MNANEALLHRYVDELNERNFAILDEVVARSVVFGSGETVSRAEYRRQIEERTARLPDYHVTIDELWCDGDEVAIRWTHCGTDPATGEQVVGHAASAYRIVNGRIVEVRSLEESVDERAATSAMHLPRTPGPARGCSFRSSPRS